MNMKKRLLPLILVLGLLLSLAAPAMAANKYEGILPGAWYEKAAHFVIDEGIMNGTGTSFAPDAPLTCAQVVQALYNASGQPEVMDWMENPYTDTAGTWYEDAATWSTFMWMGEWMENGAFDGGRQLTRAETAGLLADYAYYIRDVFETGYWEQLTDVPDFADIPEDYLWGMAFCRDTGIINGDSRGYLRPNEVLTRAQLAQMIYNLYQWTPPPVVPDESITTFPGRAGSEIVKVAVLKDGYLEWTPDMWREVCAAFADETGYGVELTTSRTLDALLDTQMKRGEFPDVAYLSTGRELGVVETLVEERCLADLTDVLSMTVPGETKKVSEKLLPGFTETALTNPYGDGKTYLAPVFYGPCGLYYNANLFAKKGWELPETWDEMWALGDRAKKEGISLFTWPTTGYLDQVLYALLYEAGGPELFERAARYEEGVWDSQEAQKCIDVMAKLAAYAHPLTTVQANDHDFQMNQQLVLDNKALFMPNGSWIMEEMEMWSRAEGFEWGVMPLPAFVGGERYVNTWIGQCWIPAAAEHADAGKAFVAFLYSDKACGIFAGAGAVQPVCGIGDKLADGDRLPHSVYEDGAKPAMGNFSDMAAPHSYTNVREVFCDPMNELASGIITKERWLEQIRAGCERLRANLK